MRPVTGARSSWWRRPPPWWLPLGLLLGACSTRVVELSLPDAAVGPAGGTSCETFKRSDGATCQVCFTSDGSVLRGECTPPATVGPPSTGGQSGRPQCKTVPTQDTRCLSCQRAGINYMPCLKCEPPVMTSGAGDRCRTCVWDDQPATRCLQCFTADGQTISDDCNTLRGEEIF